MRPPEFIWAFAGGAFFTLAGVGVALTVLQEQDVYEVPGYSRLLVVDDCTVQTWAGSERVTITLNGEQ